MIFIMRILLIWEKEIIFSQLGGQVSTILMSFEILEADQGK
jgi:hypothetical protein